MGSGVVKGTQAVGSGVVSAAGSVGSGNSIRRTFVDASVLQCINNTDAHLLVFTFDTKDGTKCASTLVLLMFLVSGVVSAAETVGSGVVSAAESVGSGVVSAAESVGSGNNAVIYQRNTVHLN